jgi:hypothetical protein
MKKSLLYDTDILIYIVRDTSIEEIETVGEKPKLQG